MLIEPAIAQQYEAAQIAARTAIPASMTVPDEPTLYPLPTSQPTPSREHPTITLPTPMPTPTVAPKSHTFIGTADVNAATAKVRLVQIAEEIVSLLASDPQATVRVIIEINAEFPAGVSDQIKRAVSENATSLGFKNKTWE